MELTRYKIGRTTWFKCLCDKCSGEYDITLVKENIRKKGNLIAGRNLCRACAKEESFKLLAKVGTEALKKIPEEKRLKNASAAGKIGAKSENSGRFTSQKWQSMSPEDQRKQVMRASRAFQKKLNSDPEYRDNHYQKIFKQLKIGYISKAHHELHENLAPLGFEMHFPIGAMQVDECNERLKIAIEYNGDFWHCNPEKWTSDQYNKAIKMTAGEKWTADLNRKRVLTKLGYEVLVIWESEWIKDKNKCLDRIKKKIDEITLQKTNPA